MELPLDAVEEDSWWLEEAANVTEHDQSVDSDSFGEFNQANVEQINKEPDAKVVIVKKKETFCQPKSF